VFEIRVPFIFLQPEIQVKQISHVFSTSPASVLSLEEGKATLTFAINERIFSQHIAFSSLLTLFHQCEAPEKNFCQCIEHSRIATRLTPTRPMRPLTCEL
jgi:hypothetical protein